MGKNKKHSAKKQPHKQIKKIQWQKLKWPLALACVCIALLACLSVLLTMGIPVKKMEAPNGRIVMQMRWKGFGRYDSEYLVIPQGKEMEVNLRKVRRIVAAEFTATSRYALLVYKGPRGEQYFFVNDYQTGRSGFVNPSQIFRPEVPSREGATDVKVTFDKMDPEFDAVVFRVDYTMANGLAHYEHITYNINTEHLQ